MTRALKELEAEGVELTQELLAALSPYRTHHINRFGIYEVRDREPAPVDYAVIFERVESLAAPGKDKIGR
jgi:hypothetical protein